MKLLLEWKRNIDNFDDNRRFKNYIKLMDLPLSGKYFRKGEIKMIDNQKKLLDLLKDMFQFEQSDLDFGIYRIMNMKRDEISKYLNNDLVKEISDGINALVDTGNESKIKEIQLQIESTKNTMIPQVLKDQAIAELEKQLESFKTTDISDIEGDVYNHLISFFSRYYDDGDFISQRRYKDGAYAIPYEGEEVKLYWANADQFFIKTTENFTDYTFKTIYGKTVMFKVVEAEVERENNKASEKRFFCVHREKPFEIIDGNLVIYVEYKNANYKKQDDASKEIIETLKTQVKDFEFTSLFNTPNSKEKSELEKQLFRYTAKNTYDYFIHKDLGKFLRRELDFYIKNEVIYLDDLYVGDMNKTKEYLVKANVIKNVANKLITFISQIEDFQKKMYLKKKLIVDTQYCITLDRIPENMYPEIIANDAQREEWVKLFAINEIKGKDSNLTETKKEGYSIPLTVQFLKENPFLVLDTAFFSNEFKERLIETFNNLDETTEGLMVQSDNFQMLNLLGKRYFESINCIYVDPPYNTDSSPIMYKNNYKDSSWNSLIYDRLVLARKYLKNTGLIIQAIDDVEYRNLINLSDLAFGKENYISTITTLCNPQGRVANNVNKVSEYHILHAKKLPLLDEISTLKIDNKSEMTPFKRTGTNSRRIERPKRFYPMLVKDNIVSTIPYDEYIKIYDNESDKFNDEFVGILKNKYEKQGYEFILPVKEDGTYLVWQREYPRTVKECSTYVYKNGAIYTPGFEREVPKTLWKSELYANPEYGTEKLKNMLQNIVSHDLSKNTAKSIYTLNQFIDINDNDLVLDYFAGSGTTGHAVINYNRDNNGDSTKKFILCEMGEYFDSVTKPRIEKCIYTDSWKNSKPLDSKGVSQSFKYFRLESYEDSLNNIKFNERIDFIPNNLKEEYILKYMMENDAKETMFNVKALKHPFDYSMNINFGQESKWTNVDLVETFNYLIGLVVEKNYAKQSYNAEFRSGEYGVLNASINKGTAYTFKLIKGHSLSGDKILVIWRNLTDDIVKDNAVLDAVLINNKIVLEEFDKIYVNGDNNIQNTNGNKITLIEEEMQKCMFEE